MYLRARFVPHSERKIDLYSQVFGDSPNLKIYVHNPMSQLHSHVQAQEEFMHVRK